MDSIWKASILLFLLIQQYKWSDHIRKQTQQDTSVLHSRTASDHYIAVQKNSPPLQALGLYICSCYWVLASVHWYDTGKKQAPRGRAAEIGYPWLFWWVMRMSCGLCNTFIFWTLVLRREACVCLSCSCSVFARKKILVQEGISRGQQLLGKTVGQGHQEHGELQQKYFGRGKWQKTGEEEDEQKGGGKEVAIKLPSWLFFPHIFPEQKKVQQRIAKAKEVSEGFSAVRSNLPVSLDLGSDITQQLSQI